MTGCPWFTREQANEVGDLTLCSENDKKYLEFNEREMKTSTGNSTNLRPFKPKIFANSENADRCSINAYKLFARNRPEAMCNTFSPFYLAINYKPSPFSPWFKSLPMGNERLQQTMIKIATNAGLVGHFTNHSVRKTMCTQLLHAGVPPTTIAQLSGHKNVQSINQYAVASKEQQQSMCQILQGQKRSSPAFDITVKRPALVPLTSDNSLQAELPSKQPRYGYASNSNGPVNPGIAASNVNSSQTHSMISGLFAGAVFHGPVNITFSK